MASCVADVATLVFADEFVPAGKSAKIHDYISKAADRQHWWRNWVAGCEST